MTGDFTNVSPKTITDNSQRPMVSVVLVNWNRAKDILDNIRWLQNQTWQNREIIVVDNGSSDASVALLRRIEGIRLIELSDNFGPARARNEGIREASGEFILLLDSDSYLGRTGLAKLVAQMQKDPSIGIIGCRILNWFTGGIDQWFYPGSYEQFGDTEFETYSFSAAGAMLRTSAVRNAGGFWNELFIYNEEVDLSIGIIRGGHRIIYTPEVAVFHRMSTHGRVPSPRYLYYQIRNWIWIMYRHYPFWPRVIRIIMLSVVYLIKGLKHGCIMASIGGIYDGIKGWRWVHRFPQKLTTLQIDRVSSLNRRWALKPNTRPRTTTTSAPRTLEPSK